MTDGDDETDDEELDDRYRRKLTSVNIRTTFREATRRAVATRDTEAVVVAVRTLLADCAWLGLDPLKCL